MALIIVILINAFKHICEIHEEKLVASSGIEPESGASETLILSIVLRGQKLRTN